MGAGFFKILYPENDWLVVGISFEARLQPTYYGTSYLASTVLDLLFSLSFVNAATAPLKSWTRQQFEVMS